MNLIKVFVLCLMVHLAVTKPQHICDARQFRQALANICAFQRRSISQEDQNAKYYYQVQAGSYQVFPEVNLVVGQPSIRTKRHRQFNLHRMCCTFGCTKYDIATVC